MSEYESYESYDVESSKPSNGTGIAALILGIASIATCGISCCCTYWGIVTFGLALAALILSIVASNKAKSSTGVVPGVTKAAKIVAIVALVIAVILGIYDIIQTVVNVVKMLNGTNTTYNMLNELLGK